MRKSTRTSRTTKPFLQWNKTELFNEIDNIEIFREGDQVITKFHDRIISNTNVSKLYEIFDLSSFLKSKIEQIEENFNINYYRLTVKGGIQELVLLSDEVTIGDVKFHKSFYILNSTDKSRRLNMNMGLFRSDNKSYVVGSIKNMSLSKKHLKGVTDAAEQESQKIDVESFDEQINSIKSLIGESVYLSKVREIIVDKDLKINHRKFDALKNMLVSSTTDRVSVTDSQFKTLTTPSEKLTFDSSNDFYVDAFKVFNCYIQVFSNQDSSIVKRETEKILKITQCFLRKEGIDKILDFLA
jgi:hypothetical protein